MKKLTLSEMRKGVLFGKYLFGFAMAVIPFLSSAQTTVTIGTGTSTTNNAPVNATNVYHYSESIYKASDIIAAGGTGMGTITKIRYYLGSATSTANSTDWTVYLGHTTKVSFTSTTDWITSGITSCFSGTVTYPAVGNWMEITLTTPFQWNGVDNIVVGVDENQAGAGSGVFWRYSTYGTDYRTIYYGNASTNPNPASPPTASSRGQWAPNIQFEWTAAPACSTPSHATTTVNNASICPGQSVNLGISGGSFATGLSYSWQYNDGSGWLDYPSATASTYSTAPAQTMNIRAVTTCGATGDQDFAEEASVVVNPVPVMAVNTPSSAFCAGSSVSIVASGADTYAWTPATGLNVTNNDTVNANPTAITTYTVTGTNSFGCTATTTAMVAPLTLVSKSAVYSPTTICAPGSPVTVQASVTPAVISGGSTWEYHFVDANGAELQPWGANDTYTFVPGADSVYSVYYDVRSNGCSDNVDSSKISIPVGFGADVSVIGYDCNNLGGTVSLSNTFGQVTVNPVYNNPFANASTDLTNVTLQGVAAITAGRAVLTPSATSNNGSVIITDPNFHTGSNNAMTLSFKLTADQPINTYGTGGGDGLSYSFADDISNTGNQNGSGSKLRLVFDAADNTTNLAGIYIVYGNTSGVSATAVTPTAASTVAYAANTASWKLGTDVPVVFTIDVSGKASLTVGTATIFTNVQMPAAYMSANTSTWKQAFSASTGGDALRHAISNVTITAPTSQFALVAANQTPATWQSGGTFTGIQPGTYDVWMSSNGTTSCAKKIETVEIENLNPLVELGNDTVICQGESLVLDAGNAGATYVWSGSLLTTQTRTVTQAGVYVVSVTNSDGCMGVGSITIGVNNTPTANSSLYVVNNMPTYTFTVLNPQNVDSYTWNFGDGSAALTNAPATVSHTYTVAGPYAVTVTLTNECGSETVIQTIVVTSTAGIEENGIEGLSLYPNPASDKVTITVPETTDASATVYSAAGTLVATVGRLDAQTELSVQGWNPGVYFVRIQSENKASTIKLVIQ